MHKNHFWKNAEKTQYSKTLGEGPLKKSEKLEKPKKAEKTTNILRLFGEGPLKKSKKPLEKQKQKTLF